MVWEIARCKRILNKMLKFRMKFDPKPKKIIYFWPIH
jgi:hypothetical protein